MKTKLPPRERIIFQPSPDLAAAFYRLVAAIGAERIGEHVCANDAIAVAVREACEHRKISLKKA